MHTSNHIYHHDEQELHGFLAYDDEKDTPRPAVLIAHDWTGRNDFACKKANRLAQMGYIGFALDMFGEAKLGSTTDEKMALIKPFMEDRTLLKERVTKAMEAVKCLPIVDRHRIAIIGFCFGGLCALDLARSGASIKGVVSFHGLLNKPPQSMLNPIKAKILVLHGYDDPMVRPEQVREFCQEMDEAKADWQVHMYGHIQHAFTNPAVHDEQTGLVYNALASQRAWESMTQFLTEIFNK